MKFYSLVERGADGKIIKQPPEHRVCKVSEKSVGVEIWKKDKFASPYKIRLIKTSLVEGLTCLLAMGGMFRHVVADYIVEFV